ncbi:guanylate kinase [Paenibacillus jilunlii]|uniref:guanylate kinase n=1 Tax=Paenibacillus jilunlii TaxID=682956 RepID=UPI001FCB0BA6|nr:guanylate kinase [Paenibacillus jilunlii]
MKEVNPGAAGEVFSRHTGEAMWNWLRTPKASEAKQESVDQRADTQAETFDPKIIIITGTSGAGRKRTAKQLSAALGIPYVIPYTTRAIRSQERDGEHYHFISEGEFQAMADKHAFIQSVHLERGCYGIAELELVKGLEQHNAVIVVVNHEGVRAFREKYGEDALRIFIYVTKKDIQLRLEREAAPFDLIDEYLGNYTEQVVYKRESEFLIQNMDPEVTVQRIKEFVEARISRQI